MLCAAVLPGHVQGKAYLLLHLAKLVHWTLVEIYMSKNPQQKSAKLGHKSAKPAGNMKK
jgi:hypothetical protein